MTASRLILRGNWGSRPYAKEDFVPSTWHHGLHIMLQVRLTCQLLSKCSLPTL